MEEARTSEPEAQAVPLPCRPPSPCWAPNPGPALWLASSCGLRAPLPPPTPQTQGLRAPQPAGIYLAASTLTGPPRCDLPRLPRGLRQGPLPAGQTPNFRAWCPRPSAVWPRPSIPSVSASSPTEQLQAPFCHHALAKRQSDCLFPRLAACFRLWAFAQALPSARVALTPFPLRFFFSECNSHNKRRKGVVVRQGAVEPGHPGWMVALPVNSCPPGASYVCSGVPQFPHLSNENPNKTFLPG